MPKLIKMPKDAIVYLQGDKRQNIYLIKAGSVSYLDLDPYSADLSYESTIFKKGEVFGLRSSIINIPKQETAKCLEDSTIITFTIKEFEDLIMGNPQVGIKILLSLSFSLHKLSDQEKRINSSRSIISFESSEKSMFSTAVLLLTDGLKKQAYTVFKRFVEMYPLHPLVKQAQNNIRIISYDMKEVGDLEALFIEEQNKEGETSHKTYHKNDLIFSEGEVGASFYVIRAGKVRILKIGSANKLKIVEILEKGSIFGEMAILEQAPRSATIIVDEDNTELLQLNKNNFKSMFFEHTETLIHLIKLFAKRIWHTQCRIEILETENKTQKLYKMLNFITEDQIRRLDNEPTARYSIYIPDALYIIKEWTNIPDEEVEKTFKDLELLGIMSYDSSSKQLFLNNIDEMRKRAQRMLRSYKS